MLQGCSEQIALEEQVLPCTYLAHQELESVTIIIIITTIIIIIIIVRAAGQGRAGQREHTVV